MVRGFLAVLLTAAPLALAHAESAPVDGGWNPPPDTGIFDDTGAGRPAARCHRIHPAGGCCLPNDMQFGSPCPAGYASVDECVNVRNFCPMDRPDTGMPRIDDLGTTPDAGHDLDASVAQDAPGSDDPDGSGNDDSGPPRDIGPRGELPTADSDCGCTTTGRAGGTQANLHWLALVLLPLIGRAKRRGPAQPSA